MARLVVFLVAASLCGIARAGEPAPAVGVEEKLGETFPLRDLAFKSEEGGLADLPAIFDRPVVLTFVYFRCPGICTPRLIDVAKGVDACDLVPGQDYRLLTISFDPKDTPDLAFNKRANMLGTLQKRPAPPEAWRFLTGDAENIRLATSAAGFRYAQDPNGIDWVHPGTVIFLSAEGKIVRYLNGMPLNPVDFKMAVIDAKQGRSRPVIQTIQRLCYSYDPGARQYVLRVNQVLMGATVAMAALFGWWLFRKGRRRKPAEGARP